MAEHVFLSSVPSDGLLYRALQSAQATGSFIQLCQRGNVALKVILVVCNTMSGLNFSRSCEGEWKRGQEEFKMVVLQWSSDGVEQRSKESNTITVI